MPVNDILFFYCPFSNDVSLIDLPSKITWAHACEEKEGLLIILLMRVMFFFPAQVLSQTFPKSLQRCHIPGAVSYLCGA